MAIPQIFISRDLKPDSIFRHRLEADGWRVYGESLIRFSPVPFGALPEVDWLFFYSGQGVGYFFEGLKNNGKHLPPEVRLATLGPGTATKLADLGYRADFTGTGQPEAVARQFLAIAAGQRVLFLRAAQSRQSIQKALTGKIVIQDLIVYQNEARTDFDIPAAKCLVFTSPINAKAYFQRYSSTEAKVIAIGQTTAAALRKVGVDEVRVAENPSEESLAELVLEVLRGGDGESG